MGSSMVGTWDTHDVYGFSHILDNAVAEGSIGFGVACRAMLHD